MNISCEIIKDLLPLYHDKVCSEESKVIIEEHLKNCGDCKNYLNDIDKEVLHYSNKPEEERTKINILKAVRKKFFKKKTIIILISVISVFCAFILWWKISEFGMFHEFPVAYSDTILSPEKSYETAGDIFGNSDYYRTHIIFKQIEKDGEKQIAAYIYYTKTLWNNDDASYSTSTYTYSYDKIPNVEMTHANWFGDMAGNISAIYYFVGEYHSLSVLPDVEFFEATKDAVLIWEKQK